ncbi:glycosyltransferase [Aminobacter sp. AP02]|uniref:glycosyltransferase n=1 Tax=Aminobacter sp. AP02 TaxID=2135737 RepID=UPI0011B1E9BC|nr:glycosyltransferase [Aminobacter sp. AP02]
MTEFRPLRILIANICLDGRTGTEILTREIAIALQQDGHSPIVYAQQLGPIADEIRSRGIPVTDDIRTVTGEIDLIHGHHSPVTATAIARFPNSPAIFFAHDFVSWHSVPPHLPAIRRYVAVDETVADLLRYQSGIPLEKICLLLNSVDLNRFRPGPELPPKPKRALAFAKNHQHLQAVRNACMAREIEVDFIGGAVGNITDEPEKLLPEYDLVFASALSAIEAMACGRAVIVCDGRGLAGLARPQNWQSWRRLNFGLRTLQREVTSDALIAEIDLYNGAEACAVGERTRAEASLKEWVRECQSIYADVLREHRSVPPSPANSSAAMATYLQAWLPRQGLAWPWMKERDELIAQIGRLRSDLAPLQTPGLYSLGIEARPEHFFRFSGFSLIEQWGVWTDGELASIEMSLASDAVPKAIELTLMPFINEEHPSMTVDLFVNGSLVSKRAFQHIPAATSQITGPAERWRVPLTAPVTAGGTLWLAFRIDAPCAPSAVGISNDPRRLGVGLISINLSA